MMMTDGMPDEWKQVMDCPSPSCPDGHPRWEFYSLGMVCARCEKHTGNNHQGHYWKFCKKTREMEKFHMCCPDLECEI